MPFNFFSPPTPEDIRVAYVDPILGLVRNVSICEAEKYNKKNPGTTFIFRDGNQKLRYLQMGELNRLKKNPKKALEPSDLIPCPGITGFGTTCKPPTIQIFGGGGIGAAGNAIIGTDGAILAVDIVRRGNGYQYPPLVSARDACSAGSGAVLISEIGCISQEKEKIVGIPKQECKESEVGYGFNWGLNGEDLGKWDPKDYFRADTLIETLSGNRESSGPGSGQGQGSGPGRQGPFEAGVFTPSNPRPTPFGGRTTYNLTYRLKVSSEILARIEGYKPGDLLEVTWRVTGSGDVGTGYRFTFTEKNPGKNPGPRDTFSIREDRKAGGLRRSMVVRRMVKPNVDYRVVASSDGGTVKGEGGAFVDRDIDGNRAGQPRGSGGGGIQVGTLEKGKHDFTKLHEDGPNKLKQTPGEKSNVIFADANITRNDFNDMRILAFSVDIDTPKLPKPPIPKKEVCGVVKDIIVIYPGNGYIAPPPLEPLTPIIVTIPPFTPTGDITIIGIGTGGIGIGTGGIGIGTTGPGIPPVPPTPGIGTFVGIGTSTTGIGTFITGIGTGPIGFTTTGGGGGGLGISTTGIGTGGPGIPPVPPSGPPTGINATFIPQFEVVRDPIVRDGSNLLQVTDLVGLKQTGYLNGRAYYGAVYYDNGIRYAGYYETVGEPVQVYDTLRESIIAQVTTPPSAILRQGTDIRSNDPLLNIPGTVQSTLSSRSIVGAGDYFPPSIPFVQEIIQDPTYSVVLRLKSVIVVNPGINYNVTDRIRITPSNGAVLEPVFGSFGRVIKVNVIDPGFGFTEYPTIEMFTP